MHLTSVADEVTCLIGTLVSPATGQNTACSDPACGEGSETAESDGEEQVEDEDEEAEDSGGSTIKGPCPLPSPSHSNCPLLVTAAMPRGVATICLTPCPSASSNSGFLRTLPRSRHPKPSPPLATPHASRAGGGGLR